MSWSDRSVVNNLTRRQVDDMLEGESQVFVLKSTDNLPFSFADVEFKFSELVGVGIQKSMTGESAADIPKLKKWLDEADDLVFAYFNYDTKNLLENLKSKNVDAIGFPKFTFVVPEIVMFMNTEQAVCFSFSQMVERDWEKRDDFSNNKSSLQSILKSDYLNTVERLKEHIQLGDVYEINYCVKHEIENASIKPFRLFQQLKEASPAPFSCYVADKGRYLMSSSPERFMKKYGGRIISQPMKGTNRRIVDNEAQKAALRNDKKEVAENVMITDLVRNDLSRSAKKGSVKVDELCGVYEFKHVNQMISTVSAELREDVHPLDAILNAFPMGSMTGAPKIKAMELIDQYEDFSRGLYSGSVGYFTPDLDFDFNVIIRSVLYNEDKKVITFPTGSAITINSNPEKEYEECMLKAEAMRKVLANHAK